MTTADPTPNSFRNQPDERGHFGKFGGRYVAETLMPLVLDLEREYKAAPKLTRHFRRNLMTCWNIMSADHRRFIMQSA
jgi:tryptophan synthase beta subunit